MLRKFFCVSLQKAAVSPLLLSVCLYVVYGFMGLWVYKFMENKPINL
jgi:hypothetical protein